MDIAPTAIPDVLVITPQRFGDPRGWFSETWNAALFQAAGIDLEFVQDNHSASVYAGTVRGMHYQAPPRAQDKLIRCTKGAILDVVFDARKGSPTYGEWLAEELTAQNGRQLLVPKGFLHGFLTLAPESEVQYKVTNFYDAECDGSVRWDSLGVDWGLSGSPILSDKDMSAPLFADWVSPFTYERPS
ncbi:MAG: dTDP-4-dehydrorhamnose 3,5-epimerase [Altererythrobacter sp. XM-24bin4]|uniref:dTDP-4-dehydrorhamnose 3,5-epimerase n=1 Tax=uncultured Altererythrobacter sp. TaxID=500840 RepID=UPI000D7B43C2|nr:dTDP-4-dehydrorhamnose 3,5-epimerase [uncultured Altererythrobacter sp.]PWL25286.1 MAG: dTDP-4-dehydrorhamnose 3,5-epimerase [Altererythrobacter sp. XM-24bin4]